MSHDSVFKERTLHVMFSQFPRTYITTRPRPRMFAHDRHINLPLWFWIFSISSRIVITFWVVRAEFVVNQSVTSGMIAVVIGMNESVSNAKRVSNTKQISTLLLILMLQNDFQRNYVSSVIMTGFSVWRLGWMINDYECTANYILLFATV